LSRGGGGQWEGESRPVNAKRSGGTKVGPRLGQSACKETTREGGKGEVDGTQIFKGKQCTPKHMEATKKTEVRAG
jgi:hypothetical protein